MLRFPMTFTIANRAKKKSGGIKKHLASGDWWIRQIDYLLNRKGEDMTDMNGGGGKTVSVSDGVVKLSVGCQQCAEKDNRIAELERLYKAAMKSAEDRLQAASAAEERAERLQAELKETREKLDGFEKMIILEKISPDWNYRTPTTPKDILDLLRRMQKSLDEYEKELAALKSVRVLSGDEIYNGLRECGADFVRYENAKDDHEAFERFAERLQLRCTCPPMDNQELWDFLSSREVETYEEACRRLADHIWPKVAPKPTREEVAGRIAEAFRNDVMTVFELQGKSALASSAFGDGAWYAEIVGDNSAYSSHSSRTEAEQAAREMLVDAVMSKTKN